jgi:motility quorum-sensing regulator / GCU-specific mRNA interferase toxin
MEKRRPHYDLKRIKELFNNEGTRRIRDVARRNAAAAGYAYVDEIQYVINNLCSQHFYKSMTSEQNHRLWQDVYKFTDEEKRLYIKLQLTASHDKAVLIQFKRDEGDD